MDKTENKMPATKVAGGEQEGEEGGGRKKKERKCGEAEGTENEGRKNMEKVQMWTEKRRSERVVNTEAL